MGLCFYQAIVSICLLKPGLYSTLTGWVGALIARDAAVLALPVLRAVAVVILLGVEAVCTVLAGVGVAVIMINL